MKKPKLKCRIVKAQGDGACWLLIDREDGTGLFSPDRPEDPGEVAYAVLEEELVAIRDAINVYFKEKNT